MGYYGTSHHCNEEIGALRAIANRTLIGALRCERHQVGAEKPDRASGANLLPCRTQAERCRFTTKPSTLRLAAATLCVMVLMRRCLRSAILSLRHLRRMTS